MWWLCDSFRRHFNHGDLSNLAFVGINIIVNTKINLMRQILILILAFPDQVFLELILNKDNSFEQKQ